MYFQWLKTSYHIVTFSLSTMKLDTHRSPIQLSLSIVTAMSRIRITMFCFLQAYPVKIYHTNMLEISVFVEMCILKQPTTRPSTATLSGCCYFFFLSTWCLLAGLSCYDLNQTTTFEQQCYGNSKWKINFSRLFTLCSWHLFSCGLLDASEFELL